MITQNRHEYQQLSNIADPRARCERRRALKRSIRWWIYCRPIGFESLHDFVVSSTCDCECVIVFDHIAVYNSMSHCTIHVCCTLWHARLLNVQWVGAAKMLTPSRLFDFSDSESGSCGKPAAYFREVWWVWDVACVLWTWHQMMIVLHMLTVVEIRCLTATALNPYMNPMHGRHEIAKSEICSLARWSNVVDN